MGNYLNSKTSYRLYKSEYLKPYFVDKSLLLKELIPLAEAGNNYICITRPRRFGKTVMANMIGAFFGKGCPSGDIFDSLKIAGSEAYLSHLNHHNVIHISLNELPRDCTTYKQYINRIEKRLIKDLKNAYPEFALDETEAVWDILGEICEYEENGQFVFVLDEWDFIFHRDFITEEDKRAYISFAKKSKNLIKIQKL